MNIRNVHINIIILLIIMQTRHIVPHPLFCSECLDARQDSRYHPPAIVCPVPVSDSRFVSGIREYSSSQLNRIHPDRNQLEEEPQ